MYTASGHELRKDWYGQDGILGRQRRWLKPTDVGLQCAAEVLRMLARVFASAVRQQRRRAGAAAGSKITCFRMRKR
jgi:hypothetical protein